MTAEAFFAWQEDQDELYDLVDGDPLKMMSGAKRQHDRITINLIVAVDARLRGRTCQPTIQDTGVKISDVQISRPDMAIDCRPFHRNTYIASNPRSVFEVLPRSSAQVMGFGRA